MPDKVSLHRVRLNNGGYDSSGYYFGLGLPLYVADCEDWSTWERPYYFRAYNRQDAKDILIANLKNKGYTDVRFYR